MRNLLISGVVCLFLSACGGPSDSESNSDGTLSQSARRGVGGKPGGAGGKTGAAGSQCKSDFDCPVLAICKLCPDGKCADPNVHCVNGGCSPPSYTCTDGKGGATGSGGSTGGGECKADSDCPVTAICKPCPDGKCADPNVRCVGGKCSAPDYTCASGAGGTGSCGGGGSERKSPSDCAVPAICNLSPHGGSARCAEGDWQNGRCL